MSKLLKISAIQSIGFFRAGEFWPHEGRIVNLETLDPDVLERLRAEKMLHIEVAPAGAEAEVDAQVQDALKERVKSAIAGLPADAFGTNGAPKLDPLRDALPNDAALITAQLRDEVWAELRPAKE